MRWRSVAGLFGAGLLATVVMEIFMRLLPAVGFPRVDVPALIASVLSGGVPPGSDALALGWSIHFGLGAVVFPLVLWLLSGRIVPTWHPLLKGWALGVVLFLGGEAVAIPLSGGGFFSAAEPQQGLTVLEDFLSH